ncbi:E3 ubiquitin-protein ligase makorin-like isoform X2 [Hevea brasiliensis]|uniref:E3 ubiquitin-protein ligase makorin-like isoform X2 n=1 Tax=Hevea brasiliensis TaxID=3981 RepID=UPI0025D923CB|nr:E3 ubiquitin-protein ligase makorin-like isoform X2 [Hevea brasiliensis]
MSKRVLCKFFAHGACLKGEHCEFSHDWKDPPNNICTYYQKGICSYGSRCRGTSIPAASGELSASSRPYFPPTKPAWNLDSRPNNFLENDGIIEPRNVKPEDRSLCSFAAAGNCPRGDKCPHIHGDICPTCGKHCLHPFRPEEREEHLKTCEKNQKHIEALKHSQDIECSVCLDRVLAKPTAAERKFGLLSECDHPFCISCIRNWRSNSPTSGMDVNTALRACPICRKLSYFVVPSVIWYSSKEEKQEIIDSYKAKLRSIDCKHFDFGNGNCPFGTSCFYKHTIKPGSYAWKYHRPPPRRPCSRRTSVVDNMNAFFDLFEHLIEEDELDIFDVEDYFDEDYVAFLLMLMNIGSANTSIDDENSLF